MVVTSINYIQQVPKQLGLIYIINSFLCKLAQRKVKVPGLVCIP